MNFSYFFSYLINRYGDTMEFIKKMRTYLLEEEFQIRANDKYVNVVSYEKILHFDNHNVSIQYQDKTITISGKNLVVSKLVNDEVLVCGIIQKIELG